MNDRLLRLVLLLVALLLLSPACTSGGLGSSKDADADSKAQKGKAGATSASASPAAAVAKEFSKVNIPAPPLSQRTPECVTAQPKPLSSPIPEDRSFIHITIAPVFSMGPNCNQMAPGGDCQVPLRGAWRVDGCPTQSCGSVVIQVFEDDAKEPVRSPEVGPIPAAGQFTPISSRLTYKVGKDAKTATLRAILKDVTGRIIARSEPYTVSLPVCLEEGST